MMRRGEAYALVRGHWYLLSSSLNLIEWIEWREKIPIGYNHLYMTEKDERANEWSIREYVRNDKRSI